MEVEFSLLWRDGNMEENGYLTAPSNIAFTKLVPIKLETGATWQLTLVF